MTDKNMTITLSGSSGYFSPPSDILDPFLFEGNKLLPNVRDSILTVFHSFMDGSYNNSKRWSTLWLAGSGVSYQWAADRGNGDLDVLFGIDYDKFLADNPDYQWMDRHEIAQAIDSNLKRNLWPKTNYSQFRFGDSSKYYEITFFLNENITADSNSIVNIHPYAAYNLTKDDWTVKPSKNTANVNNLFEEHVEFTRKEVQQLADSYNELTLQLSSEYTNSPRYINLESRKNLVVAQVRQLFDSIHHGRSTAFSGQGEGYSDFANYFWQAAKRDGIINALRTIIAKEDNGKLG